jgi:hypothetical protein
LTALLVELKGNSGNSLKLTRDSLPLVESHYDDVVELLRQLKGSELDSHVDGGLIASIEELLSYGSDWPSVFQKLYWRSRSDKSHDIDAYGKCLLSTLSLLNRKRKVAAKSAGQLVLDSSDLEENMRFYKIAVPGYRNDAVLAREKEDDTILISPKTPSVFSMKARSGDPAVYLHNPLREDIIFVKDRFLGERFSGVLLPFMRKNKLRLYLCSVDTMISYLAKVYGKDGVFNIVAVSKKDYLKDVDDRTLFIVLRNEGDGFVPVEMCYGMLLNTVSLVQMQTFAFCAGLSPENIEIIDMNGEFERFDTEEYAHHILDPGRIALLGWWNGSFKRSVELYFHQSMRIALRDLVFLVVNFLKEKGAPISGNIFKEAAARGFSIEDYPGRESEGAGILPLETGLRYRFFNYLQTMYGGEYTEGSTDALIEELMNILALTVLDPNPQEDVLLKKKEIFDLYDDHSVIRKIAGRWNDSIKEHTGTAEEKKELERKKDNQLGMHKLRISLGNRLAQRVIESDRKIFNADEYRVIKALLLNIDKLVLTADSKESIKSILDPVFDSPITVDIGKKRLASFPPLNRVPVEFQAEELIKKGYRSFIFYGTSGGVNNAPVEAFIIPKTIFFYPGNYARIDIGKYVPLPVENVLLDESAESYFNTDTFYKTEHIFVSATFQEHKKFLARLRSRFGYEKLGGNASVSVDMDLAPLAKVCMDHGCGLGGILYNTDVLEGAHQNQEKKGYYIRQMILGLLRGFEGRALKINGRDIEDLFGDQFESMLKKHIRDFILDKGANNLLKVQSAPVKKVAVAADTPMDILRKKGASADIIAKIEELWIIGEPVTEEQVENLGIRDKSVVQIFNGKLRARKKAA